MTADLNVRDIVVFGLVVLIVVIFVLAVVVRLVVFVEDLDVVVGRDAEMVGREDGTIVVCRPVRIDAFDPALGKLRGPLGELPVRIFFDTMCFGHDRMLSRSPHQDILDALRKTKDR